jgi:hypothetical protein
MTWLRRLDETIWLGPDATVDDLRAAFETPASDRPHR